MMSYFIGILRYGTSIYEGHYKNIYNPNGSSKLRCNIGVFKQGNFTYIGQFNDDECDGNCIAKYENGDVYIGKYSQGKRNGKGIYFYSQDNMYFDGFWYDDKYFKSNLTILKNKISFKNIKIGDIVENRDNNLGIVFEKISNGWCKVKCLNNTICCRVSDLLLITFK